MSPRYVQILFLSLIAVSVTFSSSIALADTPSVKTWRVNSSLGLPYARVDGTGPMDLILAEIFRRAGIPAQVSFAPAERSLYNLNEGIDDADGFRSQAIEGTMPNIVCVPEPVLFAQFCAYTRRDSKAKVASPEDLQPFHVAVLRGRPALLKRLAHVRKITEVNAQDSLFRMLEAGRVEAVVSETFVARVLLRDLGITNIVESPTPMGTATLHLYINDRHRSWLPRLNEAISAMTADHFVDRTFTEESLEPKK